MRSMLACRWATSRCTSARVLQEIIEADSVLPDLTQAKLEGLVRWVSDLPSFRITYPDPEGGVATVLSLIERISTRRADSASCG